MDLLDLMVKIGVDDQATSRIGDIAGKVKSGVGTVAKAGAAVAGVMTAATTAATAALTSQVGAVAEYGDNIDKMSQKMGLSAEAYQEWDAVMQHSGTSMESMKVSMKTLANAAETGNEAFQRLGLSQEQIASMSQEELFEATISGLQNVSDTTERTYLAGQLLGRGATELGALLNTSAEDTQAMRDRVHELGGVMSDEAVKAAARFQDSLQDMHTAIDGVRRNLTAEFLPGVADVMDGLTELFAGNYDEGLEQIGDGVDNVIGKMNEMLPKILEVGGGIVGALVQGIIENFPNMVQSVADGIVQMADYISANSDSIVESAGQVLMSIVEALIQIIPPLLAALGKLIGSLVISIVEHAPDILAAAIRLFGSFIEGIDQECTNILKAVGGLLGGIFDSISSAVQDMVNAGANLVQGLIDGITSGIGGVWDALMGGVSAAVDGVKGFLGIHSPSKLFAEIGENTMLGLADGIDSNADKAYRAMQGAVDGISGMEPEMRLGLPSGAATAAMQGVVLNIYVTADRWDDYGEVGRKVGDAAALALKERW